jgi:hypothetical protein
MRKPRGLDEGRWRLFGQQRLGTIGRDQARHVGLDRRRIAGGRGGLGVGEHLAPRLGHPRRPGRRRGRGGLRQQQGQQGLAPEPRCAAFRRAFRAVAGPGHNCSLLAAFSRRGAG